MKNIGIVGCGWLGAHLAEHLSGKSNLYVTTRSFEKDKALKSCGYKSQIVNFSDDALSVTNSWSILDELDVVVITVPFSKRTDVNALRKRFDNMINFIDGFEKQLFLMSSIGIYPQENGVITERTFIDEKLDFKLLFVEKMIRTKFPKVNILRLGGLMGGSRVFRRYTIQQSTLNQQVNHVHYTDVCAVIGKMIQLRCESTLYNLVAPMHPTKSEVVSFQKNEKGGFSPASNDRIVVSTLLEHELKYSFLQSDPRKFY